jgi:hypothetical protein
MKSSFDADERTGTDLALFAVGFAGFILGSAGIILRSTGIAGTGLFLLAVAVFSFLVRPSPGD